MISTKNISIIFLLFANLSFSLSRVFLPDKRQIRQHHAASLDDQSIIFCLFCKLPSLSFALNFSMHLEGDNSIHFLWNSHFSGRVRIHHSSEHCIQEGLVDGVGGPLVPTWPRGNKNVPNSMPGIEQAAQSYNELPGASSTLSQRAYRP